MARTKAHKWVYFFGDGKADGAAHLKELLGGKGANLAEMTLLEVPVPAGFTVSTEVCTYFYQNERTYPAELAGQVEAAMAQVEKVMGAKFGDAANPLLVSVRSGARASMPGMMDTVLNLGLNDTTVAGLIARSGDERFAYDSYRRFVTMYSDVVLEVKHEHFEQLLNQKKAEVGKELDTELGAADWRDLVGQYKAMVLKETGRPFPDDPWQQLWGAVGAVFGSWMNPRAITYRKLNEIPESWGTAVNVQSMVFGNMGDDSATGVAFTRDPSTGEHTLYGEFLINAQGEDVVAGIRTPQQMSIAGKERQGSDLPSMEELMPDLYRQFEKIYQRLEKHYRDMQDMEFTIQQGRLWVLQTRNGKRTTKAAIKIAVDMVNEKLISKDEALLRIAPKSLDQLLHPSLDPKATKDVIATGLPASPGAATGQVVFTADEAETEANAGRQVILVRDETSPEDIHGMYAARGIVTARGGMTSHAAVVARGMGRACVAGCGAIKIDLANETFAVNGKVIAKGDWITIDGSSGHVMLGRVPTIQPSLTGDFAVFIGWADEVRRLKVRANADTPDDAKVAREFGAEGIGLCRTEHMFFEADRIISMREMILAKNVDTRRAALAKLLPMQRSDFEGIFRAMQGYPVTIRLLDPPLHEFIPHDDKGQQEVADSLGIPVEEVRQRVADLHEFNPMLGHRGCRLGVTYPEVYAMQVRAIMEAACNVVKNDNITIVPEIMIPLVGNVSELSYLRQYCEYEAGLVLGERKMTSMLHMLGTMIELPRAALTAEEIAREAEFFSFGTNDLTQTTLGISRDDAGRFLVEYVEKGLLEKDPFVSIDQVGVGALVRMACEKGRSVRPHIKLGVCGEHGGDPASVEFFHGVGLDYVSCSPYRVPIARLAAAQAVLNEAAAKGKGRKK